jgi:hypothetical protein
MLRLVRTRTCIFKERPAEFRIQNFEYVCYGDHKNAIIFFCISSSLRDIKNKQLEQEHSFILLFYIKKWSHSDFREGN